MIISLRDLEIGTPYLTEKQTCLMRSSTNELELGEYFSKKGGFISIPIPQTTEEENEQGMSLIQSLKGDLLPEAFLFAIEKFSIKKITEGISFYELKNSTQKPEVLRLIRSIDDFLPSTTYVTVDNTIKLRKLTTGRIIFKFSRKSDILPELTRTSAIIQRNPNSPRQKLLITKPARGQSSPLSLTSHLSKKRILSQDQNCDDHQNIDKHSSSLSSLSKENQPNFTSNSPPKKQKIESNDIDEEDDLHDVNISIEELPIEQIEKHLIRNLKENSKMNNHPTIHSPVSFNSSIPIPPPPPSAIPPPPPLPPRAYETPKKRMKPLRWSAIPNHKIKSTVWGQSLSPSTSPSKLFSENEIESLFSLSPNKNNNIMNTPMKFGNKTISRISSILPVKRSNNISIVLSRLNVNNIKNSLLLLSGEVELTVDQLLSLRSILPVTEEEFKLLDQYEPKNHLNRAEKFILEIGQVQNLDSIVDSLIFRLQVDDYLQEIRQSIEIIQFACEEIKNSQRLPKLLKVILAVGSVLNRDTYLSSKGFKLESLRSLSETTDKTGKLTLLHYISKIVNEKTPELLHFIDDLPHCNSATKVSLEKVLLDFKFVNSYFTTLKKEISFLQSSSTDESMKCLLQKLEELYQNVSDQIASANINLTRLQNIYDEVCF